MSRQLSLLFITLLRLLSELAKLCSFLVCFTTMQWLLCEKLFSGSFFYSGLSYHKEYLKRKGGIQSRADNKYRAISPCTISKPLDTSAFSGNTSEWNDSFFLFRPLTLACEETEWERAKEEETQSATSKLSYPSFDLFEAGLHFTWDARHCVECNDTRSE